MFLLKIFKTIFMVECPNCASAWTGGHPNPQDIEFCLFCSDKSGKITGFLWRWHRLNFIRLNRNLRKVKEKVDMGID